MSDHNYGQRVKKPLKASVDLTIDRLKSKPTVSAVNKLKFNIIEVKRKIGYSDLVIYIVDAYVLGEGATLNLIKENPEINTILVVSNWNQYTYEAQELAKEYNVAVFTFNEIMGAVYYRKNEYINYENNREDK